MLFITLIFNKYCLCGARVWRQLSRHALISIVNRDRQQSANDTGGGGGGGYSLCFP